MNRKAQGATEYLIILAVVIIVALIVVGVMGGIPGIGGAARNRAAASYWLTSDIAIPSVVVSTADDNITIALMNNLRDTITISTLKVGGLTLTCNSNSLAPGQVTNCDAASTACAAAGDAFTYDASIGYKDEVTGASYTFTGEGHKLEGKCAT